jgi:hypothetical protein
MTQDEIDRAIILIYRSNRSDQAVNFVRPAGWLDKLSVAGLEELKDTMQLVWAEANDEIMRRNDPGNETALDAHDQGLIDAAWKAHSDPEQCAAAYAKVCAEQKS